MTHRCKSIAVRFDRAPNVSRRVTLAERIQRMSGVIEARFDSKDFKMLTVRFRDGSLSPTTLLDYLSAHNLPATLNDADDES